MFHLFRRYISYSPNVETVHLHTTPPGHRSETYTVPSFELTGAGTALVTDGVEH